MNRLGFAAAAGIAATAATPVQAQSLDETLRWLERNAEQTCYHGTASSRSRITIGNLNYADGTLSFDYLEQSRNGSGNWVAPQESREEVFLAVDDVEVEVWLLDPESDRECWVASLVVDHVRYSLVSESGTMAERLANALRHLVDLAQEEYGPEPF